MTWKTALWGLALQLCAGLAVAENLELTAGAQFRYESPTTVARAAVGDPKLLSAQVLSAREILLTPKAPGNTTLMLWPRGGPAREYAVTIMPAGLVADGAIEARQVGGKTLLQGTTDSLVEHSRAAQLLDAKTTVDTTEQAGGVQVQTDIRIIEISRSNLKQVGAFLGVNRPAFTFASGPAGSFQGVDSDSGIFTLLSAGGFLPSANAHSIVIGRAKSEVLGAISALQSNGFAYTLAEPSLVSLSGQSATFLAGGEFPYPSANRNGDIQIEFKEFGVRLQLTPTVIDPRRIMLKVAPEVSELDFNGGVKTGGVQVPGLRIRRTDTAIQLAPGESFIIGGLISSNTMSQLDKFPGLGDLPVLGAFFRSTRFSREDRELIMIVTPHLVDPIASAATLPEPGRAYRTYTPGFGDMLFGDSATPGAAAVGFSR